MANSHFLTSPGVKVKSLKIKSIDIYGIYKNKDDAMLSENWQNSFLIKHFCHSCNKEKPLIKSGSSEACIGTKNWPKIGNFV